MQGFVASSSQLYLPPSISNSQPRKTFLRLNTNIVRTLKGCTALFLVTCVQKISFSCVFFPPKDKRIFCYQNLLTKVDPFNVTFRIHTLLDMTSDERQNQANEVKVWCSSSYSTRTEHSFVLVPVQNMRSVV